jgi:hypothetical protein
MIDFHFDFWLTKKDTQWSDTLLQCFGPPLVPLVPLVPCGPNTFANFEVPAKIAHQNFFFAILGVVNQKKI